jgi:uncharacterized protein with PIN domain
MIVVDTSIVVAIIRGEQDGPTWVDILDHTRKSLISVVSYVETHMIIAGRRSDAQDC